MSDTPHKVTAKERCRKYRRRILEISQQVPAAHIAPAFSCIEIVDALYNEIMAQEDIFIMSKGHGCLAQYVILEEQGKLSRAHMDAYCQPGGKLGAHPDYAPELGIHASTGSLGHGLGIAVGQAYAEMIKHMSFKTLDRTRCVRVYVLLSDGECQEGSTWEAAMMAANLKLGNLVAVVDNNDFGGLDRMSTQHPAFYPLGDKFSAFGWQTLTLGDAPVISGDVSPSGHDSSTLVWAIDDVGPGERVENRPGCVVCKTIKGKGVSYMENNNIWHYRSPNEKEYAQALKEIGRGGE